MAIETVVNIVIGLEDAPDSVDKYIRDWQERSGGPERLAQLLHECASGCRKSVVMVQTDEADGTEAYDYLTLSQGDAAADDTVTVLGVVFTAKASASTDPIAAEFAIGADDDAMTDNLVAAINAHPALRHIVHAQEDGGDTNSFYIQYRCPGPYNFGTVTTSNATAFVVENGTFTGGATGTQQKNTRGWDEGLRGSDPGQLTHA